MRTRVIAFLVLVLPALFTVASGCARSRADAIRDHAAVVEKKLEAQRDQVLSSPSSPEAKDQRIGHLQTLRVGLSMVNISLASVPLLLKDESQRNIGYSVLDEALGTIDWNIPIYQSSTGTPREYPSLFSPQMGLDFASIQSGVSPGQASPNNGVRPPGFAR